jgi:hypothetical protein
MTRPTILLATFLMALSLPLRAQETDFARDWRRFVRVGKWVLAGATVALGVYAYAEHGAAERAYDDLRDRCDSSPATCNVTDGRYTDVESEALHQRAVRHDRRARAGILAGQITLLGGVALFLYDLRNDGGPDNIPYPSPWRPAQRAAAQPASALRDRTLILGARVPF